MEENNFPSSITARISSLVNELDNKIGQVVDSSSGRVIEFRVGRVFESLMLSGLDYYAALTVIENIDGKFYPGIETKNISEAIIQELYQIDNDWAKNFRIKYDEGITIQTDGTNKEILRTSSVKTYLKTKLNAKGFYWGSKKLVSDFSTRLVDKCRKLGIPNIPQSLLEELFEQELFMYFENRTIDDLHESFPSEVPLVVDDINNSINSDNFDQGQLLNGIKRLCKAILFRFSYIPSNELSDCINETITILEENRDPDSAIYETIMNFITTLKKDAISLPILLGKKCPESFIIEKLIYSFRRLSYLISKDANVLSSIEIMNLLQEDSTKEAISFLSRFALFIWPEEWLAASTLHHLRHEILTLLYRYRCISVIHLTKMLQVHPKHTLRAITPLIKDGLIVKHRLTDGELIIITLNGEAYCEQNLGLKLRCSLSRV